MTKLEELKECIDKYGNEKAQLDQMKKSCDELNTKIKKLLEEEGLDKYETDEYKISCVVQKRETIDENKLIPFTHEHEEFAGVVKLKEYVDYDELETLIYNGKIPQELLLEMNKFKNVKEVPTLRVSKNG